MICEKECSKCLVTKPLSDYHKASDGSLYGVRSACKSCRAIEAKAYGAANRDAISKRSKEWALKNPERAKANARKWRKENPEEVKLASDRWRNKNPERAKEVQREASRKRRSTPIGKVEDAVRRRINECIEKGSKFGRKTFELLGYTAGELMAHIERQFLPGMSWENRAEWEIDHKIPLSVHNYRTPDDIDFKKAWALDNLRPLWRADNRRKHAKLTKPFQPSLALAA